MPHCLAVETNVDEILGEFVGMNQCIAILTVLTVTGPSFGTLPFSPAFRALKLSVTGAKFAKFIVSRHFGLFQ